MAVTRLPEPNACFACDMPEQGHANRWVPSRGWHMWITPPNALRLSRMKAHRAASAPVGDTADAIAQDARTKRREDI